MTPKEALKTMVSTNVYKPELVHEFPEYKCLLDLVAKAEPMKPVLCLTQSNVGLIPEEMFGWYACSKCKTMIEPHWKCCPYCETKIDWGDFK